MHVSRRLAGTPAWLVCLLGLAFTIVLSALITACAGVIVRKIPTPTQYGSWDDERQRDADSKVGFRYYLPRPFVAVRREFPLGSDAHFINAEWSLETGVIRIPAEEISKAKLEVGGVPGAAPAIAAEIPEHAIIVDRAKVATLAMPRPPVPRVVGRAGAVGLTTAHQKQATQVGQSLGLSFQVGTAVLNPAGNEGKTIVRAMYLAPLDGAVVTAIPPGKSDPNGWIRLPFACLEAKTAGVELNFRGYLPGLKKSAYVAAVHTIKRLQPGVYESEFAFNANADGSGDVVLLADAASPSLGQGALTSSNGLRAVDGMSVDMRSPHLPGPWSRLDFTLTVEMEKLKTADNGTLASAKQLATSLIGVAVCPLAAGGEPDLATQLLLPIDLRKSLSDKKAEYHFNAVLGTKEKPLLAQGLSANTAYVVVAMIQDTNDVKGFFVNDKGFLVNASEPATFALPDDYPPEPANDPVAKKVSTATKSPSIKGGSTVALGHDSKNPGYEGLSEFMAIAYLPDFDEQYAVEPYGGPLTKLSMQLKNGWMMETVNAEIDNSAIYDFVFEQLGKVVDVATDVVRLDKGLLAPATAGGPQLQAGSGAAEPVRSVPITLKVTRLRYAVPGLYPILKPRELLERQRDLKVSVARNRSPDGVPTLIKGANRTVADMVVDFGTREDVVYELVRVDLPLSGAQQRLPPARKTQSEIQALITSELARSRFSTMVQSLTVVVAASGATVSVREKTVLAPDERIALEAWLTTVLSSEELQLSSVSYP